MNIAVITSGGDAPGMNACIAQLVKEGAGAGYDLFGYEGGFLGIRDHKKVALSIHEVQDWYKLGGTKLRTGRFPQLKERRWQEELAANLERDGVDVLIVIGGDGSFQGALSLHEVCPKLGIIGIPGTIDNNIYGSDYTIGFDTALNTQTSYIDAISDTAMALPGRVFFVETLGAWDGYLTHSSVLMGMADFSVLVEEKRSNEEICERVKAVLDKGERDYVLVSFAEGAYQMFEAADYVREKLGLNVKCNLMGYCQRGGSPSALDRLHAAGFAKYAIKAVKEGVFNKYVVYRDAAYAYLDLREAANKKLFNWREL